MEVAEEWVGEANASLHLAIYCLYDFSEFIGVV